MKLSLFHAAPDTGNLGVSALCYSTVLNIVKHNPEAEFTIFDNSLGTRQGKIFLDGHDINFQLQGAIHSRRFYRYENILFWKYWDFLGGLGNPSLKTIRNSNAILDITGGDSFTDLYGLRRFNIVTLPKTFALKYKKPLILLPQTYGPFKSKELKEKSSEIVKKAKLAFARDDRSFDVLKDLLGSDYDPAIHKSGVDMAFGLPTCKPANMNPELESLLNGSESDIIGINISGLIYNSPSEAKSRYGFKADYNQSLLKLIERFLKETGCRVALIPHVLAPIGHFESDIGACHDVIKKIPFDTTDRITVVPGYNNPCEIKWIISKLSWFCGTRMHSTIAALSSGVPASAISYSPKTLGVFETCGQGDHVADPQKLDTDLLVDAVWTSWLNRQKAKISYSLNLQNVFKKVDEQTKFIISSISD